MGLIPEQVVLVRSFRYFMWFSDLVDILGGMFARGVCKSLF